MRKQKRSPLPAGYLRGQRDVPLQLEAARLVGPRPRPLVNLAVVNCEAARLQVSDVAASAFSRVRG